MMNQQTITPPAWPRTATETPTTAVQVRGLRRIYGQGASEYEAVRGIDLDVPTESITALLGTNGAGKTSALEVIEGLAPASGGEVRVLASIPSPIESMSAAAPGCCSSAVVSPAT